MKGFESVKQERISDRILKQLKDAILTGRYSAGDKLPPERELIENFQVSRAVVREAIRALEIAGYVNIKQGAFGGAFVNELSFSQLDDVYQDLFFADKLSLAEFQQVRLLIEPYIARVVAQKITPEMIEQIQDTISKEGVEGVDNLELLNRSTRLHSLLAEMSGNRFLEGIIKNMIKLTLKVVLKIEPDCREVHPVGMHDDILAALVNGDADAAEKAMFEHLSELTTALKEVEDEYRSLD